eukprot:TRINITY_DN12148_c0_g1_i1.p1 TRINITY_DN12148_c0_g1~~TRINITY_DN12148_c0_g1_i1.p1  ORF type:complete len:182 (+),score=29.83 TRINITY_DN12148_c0_g1_i1:106-651(+)
MDFEFARPPPGLTKFERATSDSSEECEGIELFIRSSSEEEDGPSQLIQRAQSKEPFRPGLTSRSSTCASHGDISTTLTQKEEAEAVSPEEADQSFTQVPVRVDAPSKRYESLWTPKAVSNCFTIEGRAPRASGKGCRQPPTSDKPVYLSPPMVPKFCQQCGAKRASDESIYCVCCGTMLAQ